MQRTKKDNWKALSEKNKALLEFLSEIAFQQFVKESESTIEHTSREASDTAGVSTPAPIVNCNIHP